MSWLSGAIGLFLTVLFSRITVGADHTTAVEASVSSSISHCGGISAVPWVECRAQRGSFCRRKKRFRESGVRSSVTNLTGQSGHRKGQSQENTSWGGLLSTSPQKGRRPRTQKEPEQPQAESPSRLPCFCFSWHAWPGTLTLRT